MLLAIFLSFILALGLFLIFVVTVDFLVAGKGYNGGKSDHFDGKHFWNIGWTKRASYRVESNKGRHGKTIGLLKWLVQRKNPRWEYRTIEKVIPTKYHLGDDFRITFIGHATLLIQTRGLNIITDPVWGYRTGPFSRFGPHRYMDPGVDFDALPTIDIVLLSHNHYDHMDLPTLARLEARDNPIIYTGLGNKAYLREQGIMHVTDMDWWDNETYSARKETVKIYFVPAQHFSARGLKDRNKTLWGGFVIEIGAKTLYFAGDTGYGKFIEDIREHYPKGIDIGLLPIGAYKPRWFMADIHTNPEEAMQMQKELQIKTGVGIHWGTFPLADDSQDDPLMDLAIAQEKEVYKNFDFRVGVNGTVWEI